MPESDAQTHIRLVSGRYRLLRQLGRGGIGIVWLADDTLVGRQVAVKELRPPQGLPDDDRDIYTRRALQEARSAARIHHPNAVTLYDVLPATEQDDAIYLIMELIDGSSLAAMIQRDGALADTTVASLGLQLLDVLQSAHALDIVHRDIKPGNILIGPDEQAKLTDFGIAHITGDARLTRSGVLGTHSYLAPELFEPHAPITPAADLWSLGATLFHAAEGHGPFDRDTTGAILRAILLDSPPTPRCSPALAAAITGMLQRDPAERATIDQARTGLLRAAAEIGPSAAEGSASTPASAPGDNADAPPSAPWEQLSTTLSPSTPPTPPPRSLPEQPKTGSHDRVALITAALGLAMIGIVVGVVVSRSGGGPSRNVFGLETNALRLRTSMVTPAKGEAAPIAFSPGGTMLATADLRGPLIVWNVPGGRDIAKLPYGTGTYDFAFSPDGQTLAVADDAGNLDLWDLTDHRSITSLKGISPRGVTFSPDGKTLAIADGSAVRLWDIANRRWIAALTGPGASGLDRVVFSPDGTMLAAGDGGDDMVYVWNTSDQSLIATLQPPVKNDTGGEGNWITFSPNGKTLAIGDGGGQPGESPGVRLWDTASRTIIATLTDPIAQGVNGVAFSPDSKILAVNDGGNVFLWNTTTRNAFAEQDDPAKDAAVGGDIAFNRDGTILAASDGSGNIYLWNRAGNR